jgi:hypothetical protein
VARGSPIFGPPEVGQDQPDKGGCLLPAVIHRCAPFSVDCLVPVCVPWQYGPGDQIAA